MLSGQELRHLPGGELRLTDVAEVPGEVYGLPLHQAGQQGHVTRLPPPGREGEAEPVQLVPQLLPAVLRLGPGAVRVRTETCYPLSPPQHSSQQTRVQTLRRRQPPLNLPHRHLVLGGGGQEGEAARDRAEDVSRRHGQHGGLLAPVPGPHSATHELLLDQPHLRLDEALLDLLVLQLVVKADGMILTVGVSPVHLPHLPPGLLVAEAPERVLKVLV